ncbi:sigma-70 family RNA polymerase sigma factor [Nocardioides aromaticivorans]|nr:sigma-70 family RNA polymerase sigma factor [Nocardioides aromaticivorans]
MLESTATTLADEALLDSVRAGDTAAWAELFRRHHEAAMRMARGIDPSNADDLVSEAFTRVYVAARNGAGVRSAFRAYLFQTIRNLAVNRFQRDRRLMWVDEVPAQVADQPANDIDDRMSSEMLAAAFRSLPARWQAVLWHTAVEGDDHRAVGQILGIKPNAVAALSFRAREGLRRAYIDAHVAAGDEAECKDVRRLVPGHVLGKLTAGDQQRLDDHLVGCAACTAVVGEVAFVNGRPGAALLPALVGPVLAVGYVAQGGGSGTIAVDPTPLFSADSSHHAALALGGVAVGLVLAVTGGLVVLTSDPPERSAAPGRPSASVASGHATSEPTPSSSPAPSSPAPSASAPRATSSTPSGPTSASAATPSTVPFTRPAPGAEGTASSSPSPTIPTRRDLSITGGGSTSYPDHRHLQLSLGPDSSAAGVEIRLRIDGLESFVAHRREGFRPASCQLTGDAEVTCTLVAGNGDFALDVVVSGDLTVVASVSAPGNIDPDPGNNQWRTP